MTLPEPGHRVLLPLVSLITYNGWAYAYARPPLRTDICDRTSQVQTAILAAVPFTVACGQAPQASLAGITSLTGPVDDHRLVAMPACSCRPPSHLRPGVGGLRRADRPDHA